MKKISLKVAVCLLAGSFLFSSCFVGKYGLSHDQQQVRECHRRLYPGAHRW